jgi:DNA-binding beta-propeller fold protein YncE
MGRRFGQASVVLATTAVAVLALAAPVQASPRLLVPAGPSVSAPIFADDVINPSSTTAYLTRPLSNEVSMVNLATGKWGRPIPVGSDPEGLDITPDGKTLYVADAGGQAISEITLATRKVTTIRTPSAVEYGTPFTIAVMNNGDALYDTTFNGTGYGAYVFTLNLTTHAIKRVTKIRAVTEITVLSRSANYSTVGIALGDDSGGPFDIYSAARGQVVFGGTNTFISESALNATGSTMLVNGSEVDGQRGAVYMVDPKDGALLGTINQACVSAVLNASGATGYCLTAQSIVKLDISRFLPEKGAIALPKGVTGEGQLALSPNGRTLVAITSAGATIVRL